MDRKLYFSTILFVLVFTSFANASAQTQELGVEVENLFVYDISESTNEQRNNWTKVVLVDSVSGYLVSVSELDVFGNGTEDSRYYYTYEVSLSNSNPYFFFANLSLNDPVYITEKGTISVNETINRSYAYTSRETNYIMYNDLKGEDVTIETYFDKQTGVLVQSVQKHPSTDYEIRATLKDTNVWIVAEFPSLSPTETPSPGQTVTESPSQIPSVSSPSPSASVTSTPESKPGIFLPFEVLYVIIAVIIVVMVAVAVLAIALGKRKKPVGG